MSETNTKGHDTALAAKPGAATVRDRFQQKRDDIVAAAIPILNSHGLKGMRLVKVAEVIGLKATGITYYFPRKDELAVACNEHGLAVFHDLLSIAEKETTAQARIERLVGLFVERDATVRRGEATPLASFASIRSLDGKHFEQAAESYKKMFRRARAIFETPELKGLSLQERSIRTLILLEQLYWASDWLGQYDLTEFPRLAARIADIMIHGLSASDEKLEFKPPAFKTETVDDNQKESFLQAATREINLHGYRGASVDRISASLNLTKGAFYHHNDAKDDLVAECFRRTFSIIRNIQQSVRVDDASEWECLIAAVNEIAHYQFSTNGPLLRTSILSSLPHEHQVEILDLSYRASRAFALMISDAIADGTARPVDPTIAAHLLAAGVNVASDIRNWQRPLPEKYAEPYARALLLGLLTP